MSVNRPATITIGEHTMLKSMVDSIITIILKQLLKKLVRRYMFWLELRLTCKKKNVINERFFQVSVFLLATSMDVPWSFDE